jgi:hypothetical protein
MANKLLKDILKNISFEVPTFGYCAKDIDIDNLTDYKVPNLVKDEIPTLNRFGYMKIMLDDFCNDFINYSAIQDKPCLELGTAYGFIANQVLQNGGKIIANDISFEHLSVLLKNAPKARLNDLFIYPGKFPEEVNLPSGSLGAVLSSRMFHFLDEGEIEQGLLKVHDWLEDNGIFYFISVTPYHANIRDEFAPVYEQRQKEDDLWPGKVESQWKIHPSTAQYVPEFLHVFEPVKLKELFPKFGFEILDMKMFDYVGDTDSKGIGHVGVKAKKVKRIVN